METLQKESNQMIIEHRASAVLYKYLISLDIRKKFLLPVNICPVVTWVFQKAKIAFEYCDINTIDYCIDYNSVLEHIKKQPTEYAGVLYNHTYGYENSPIDFFKELKFINNELIIIDDKCLSKPTLTKNEFADLTLYSTGYAKYIDLGSGGIGLLGQELNLKHFGETKLTEKISLQEAIFNIPSNEYVANIQHETEIIRLHKEEINSIYSHYLKDFDQLGSDWNHWRYNILLPNSERVIKLIFEIGFFASQHYAPLDEGNYPNASFLHSKIINLFNDKYFSVEKAEKLAIFLKQNFYK